MTKILFVCHGNICRSPMAEFVMKDLVKKAGLEAEFRIESAATSTEEIGNPVYSPIEEARGRALRAVNAELIQMYWNVGEHLSDLCANAAFGDKVIDEVAFYIASSGTNIKGFNRRGLYRMKQFHETYKDDEFVTPLVTQISWTNHLQIMSSAKSKDERHSYLQLCAKEHYSNCSFVNSYRFIALFLHEPTFCAMFIFQTRPSCKQFCDTKIISSPCIVVC